MIPADRGSEKLPFFFIGNMCFLVCCEEIQIAITMKKGQKSPKYSQKNCFANCCQNIWSNIGQKILDMKQKPGYQLNITEVLQVIKRKCNN